MGLRDKPADKSAVEKIQDAIETAIQPGMEFAQFVEKLKLADVETSLKFNSEGIIQGISYSTDGVAFAGCKLGRNSKACTIKGLAMRGIKFDLERDAHNSNKDDKLEIASLPKINSPIRSKTSQIEFD